MALVGSATRTILRQQQQHASQLVVRFTSVRRQQIGSNTVAALPCAQKGASLLHPASTACRSTSTARARALHAQPGSARPLQHSLSRCQPSAAAAAAVTASRGLSTAAAGPCPSARNRPAHPRQSYPNSSHMASPMATSAASAPAAAAAASGTEGGAVAGGVAALTPARMVRDTVALTDQEKELFQVQGGLVGGVWCLR